MLPPAHPHPLPPPQVEKAIKTRKAKLVLLAPNISSLVGPEGDETEQQQQEDGGSSSKGGSSRGGSAAPPGLGPVGGDPTSQPAGGASGGGGLGSRGGRAAGKALEACPASALLALAAEKEVPLVFALSRQRMGKVREGRASSGGGVSGAA